MYRQVNKMMRRYSNHIDWLIEKLNSIIEKYITLST